MPYFANYQVRGKTEEEIHAELTKNSVIKDSVLKEYRVIQNKLHTAVKKLQTLKKMKADKNPKTQKIG